eukprot:scaffold50558_cov30-Tisochrysis_lutea.AAC.7
MQRLGPRQSWLLTRQRTVRSVTEDGGVRIDLRASPATAFGRWLLGELGRTGCRRRRRIAGFCAPPLRGRNGHRRKSGRRWCWTGPALHSGSPPTARARDWSCRQCTCATLERPVLLASRFVHAWRGPHLLFERILMFHTQAHGNERCAQSRMQRVGLARIGHRLNRDAFGPH